MNQNEFSVINDEFYYDRNKLIGQGQNGVVYECYSKKQTNKRLCVKIYRLCNDQIIKDLQNEVQIVKQLDKLSKVNIIELYFGTYNKKTKEYYLIMERCDQDLKKLMFDRKQDEKNFKPTEIISFIQQFVTGYKNLFEKQIIHRDIKPANILINKYYSNIEYKIADLGSSKIYIELHNSCNFGTPLYSAPEILQGDQTNKSDVFSFGCTLYKFIYFSDFKLFNNNAPKEEIIQNYKENSIQFLNDPQFDMVLDLLSRCLIKDQKKRISWEEIFQHPVMEQGIITKIKLVDDSLFIQLTDVIQSQSFQKPLRQNNKPRDKRIDKFINLLKLKQNFILKLVEDLRVINSIYSQFFSTGLIALVVLYYRYEYGFISNEQEYIPFKKRKYLIVNYQESDFALFFMLKKKINNLDAGKKQHQYRIKQLQEKIQNLMNDQVAEYLKSSHLNLHLIQDKGFTIFMQEYLGRIKEFSLNLDLDDIITFLKQIYIDELQLQIQLKQQQIPENQQYYELIVKKINVVLYDLETKYDQMKYNLVNIPCNMEELVNN